MQKGKLIKTRGEQMERVARASALVTGRELRRRGGHQEGDRQAAHCHLPASETVTLVKFFDEFHFLCRRTWQK